jgi:ABC-2 type transport system ATP-binding protein
VAGNAIEIEDLRVSRGGRHVLRGITIGVRRGQVVGLLGPSGSGKTTLMRAIVGVQILAGGTVRVLGADAGAPELRSRVAYVTQRPSVYGDLTVLENLRYFAAVVGGDRRRVTEVVDAVGLSGRERQLTASLSGGERARVSLASALLGAPEVLVLDEPTVGLDPVLRACSAPRKPPPSAPWASPRWGWTHRTGSRRSRCSRSPTHCWAWRSACW